MKKSRIRLYKYIFKNAKFMYLQLTRLNSTGFLDWFRSRISLDKVGLGPGVELKNVLLKDVYTRVRDFSQAYVYA